MVSNSISRLGGHSWNFRLLSEGLANRGHKVTVVTTSADKENVRNTSCRMVSLESGRGLRFIGFARAVDKWLSERDHEFDVVHFNGHYAMPYVLRKKHDRPLIIRHLRGTNWTILRSAYYDDYFRFYPSHLRILGSCWLSQALDRWSMLACDHLVANCSETREDALKKVAVPAQKISVLPNGFLPLGSPLPEERVGEVRGSICEGDTFVISCLAGMSPGKGWGQLCRIAAALARLGLNFTLLLLGDGQLSKYIRADIERFGLKDRTVFKGSIHDEVHKVLYLKASDLFLYPSSPGTTVLEALAVGVPVVIARRKQDCSAGMDWGPLDAMGVGKVFYDKTAEEIAESLTDIIQSGDRLGSDKGMQYCLSELSWEKVSERAEKIYARLLEQAE